MQLCVYKEKSEKIKKKVMYGSSVTDDKQESEALIQVKEKIYGNLKRCDFHIQGCLMEDDGRHLNLTGEMVTMWARAIVRINCIIALFPKLYEIVYVLIHFYRLVIYKA